MSLARDPRIHDALDRLTPVPTPPDRWEQVITRAGSGRRRRAATRWALPLVGGAAAVALVTVLFVRLGAADEPAVPATPTTTTTDTITVTALSLQVSLLARPGNPAADYFLPALTPGGVEPIHVPSIRGPFQVRKAVNVLVSRTTDNRVCLTALTGSANDDYACVPEGELFERGAVRVAVPDPLGDWLIICLVQDWVAGATTAERSVQAGDNLVVIDASRPDLEVDVFDPVGRLRRVTSPPTASPGRRTP